MLLVVPAAQGVEKVRENRLRRMALRQGFVLHKVRRLDPRATDYGVYSLRDDQGRSHFQTRSLDDVERWLEGGEGRGG